MKKSIIDEQLEKSDFGSFVANLERDKILTAQTIETDNGSLTKVTGVINSDDCDSQNGGVHNVEFKKDSEKDSALIEVIFKDNDDAFKFSAKDPEDFFNTMSKMTVSEKATTSSSNTNRNKNDIDAHREHAQNRLKTRQAQVPRIDNVPSDYMKKLGG